MGEHDFNPPLISSNIILIPFIVIASKSKQSNDFSYYSAYSVDTNLLNKHVKAGIGQSRNHFRPDKYLQQSEPDLEFVLEQQLGR